MAALLSNGRTNAKTVKGLDGWGIESRILYLAPWQTVQGLNLCAGASPECIKGCLYTAGRGAFNNVQAARIRRTEFWRDNRAGFLHQLVSELADLQRIADYTGRTPACRLNGTSDIAWTKHPVYRDGAWHDNVFQAFPGVRFYDYTKNPGVIRLHAAGRIPNNYSVTFSLSETNGRNAIDALHAGLNVAAVLRYTKGSAPQTWSGYPVIDGDAHDFRFLDETGGRIVSLSPKGALRRIDSPFVYNLDETIQSRFDVSALAAD